MQIKGTRKPNGDTESKDTREIFIDLVKGYPVPEPIGRLQTGNHKDKKSYGGVRMNKIKDVMKRVYEPKRLIAAWQRVKENAGSAGIDGMKIKDFIERYKTLMRTIYKKLKEGIYKFKPARRVEIPKAGTKKTRKLGIPIIMDRIVAQSTYTVLEEIYDPDFTNSNYGFRKERNQHMAIKHVQRIVKEGYNWAWSKASFLPG